MMEAVDSPRPAPAGRAVWALVISAALHAMPLLSAAGKPDGGILMDKAVNPPAAAASTLQVMFQQAGAAILALSTSDAVLYRRAWPLALPPLLTGVGADMDSVTFKLTDNGKPADTPGGRP